MAIPKIIHQTIADKKSMLGVFSENAKKIVNLNPGWIYKLWDDKDIHEFISSSYGESMLSLYERIDPVYGPARADFFRYLLMYRTGGVYIDIKSTIIKKLDDVLLPDDAYLLSHWRNKTGEPYPGWGLWPQLLELGDRGEYQQWHIVAEPRHPFLSAVIERVKNNILNYDPDIDGVGQSPVIKTTGPIAYTLAIGKIARLHKHRLVDIEHCGFRFSIFETQNDKLAHHSAFENHYSLRQAPVVRSSVAEARASNASSGPIEDAALPVRFCGGLTIAVPTTLSAITTYVLLEQEDWFEKEIHFLRRYLEPGMTAIDIGANLGVYSLTMARAVAPGGRVFAYEPGGEARALLERSRALNDLPNLEIVGAALSDSAREGTLAFAASSEVRALAETGPGERVPVTRLDLEDAARGWASPDLVKIDAEGEEERIIAGGAEFFATHSPLVMFEIKAGEQVNERLRSIFPAIGYRLFRQLGGAPLLVPDDGRLPLDALELNLFAAKPDRAASLAQRNLLVDSVDDWIPSEAARQDAISDWQRQKFASAFDIPGGFGAVADADYRDSLVAYGAWRNPDRPIAARCAALAFAVAKLEALCTRDATIERLSTFARAASDWGARVKAAEALRRFLRIMQQGTIYVREPAWPASSRFDDMAPGQRPGEWFAASAAEQLVRAGSHSSMFVGAASVLAWLCGQPFAGTEMHRRRVLMAARAGERPTVPARLCTAASDHLNADLWRAGKVPGTVVSP